MQFKEFDWLSGHGIWAIIPCPTNMVSVRVILERFCFYFSLLFYILGAFLIKQLFYSACWIWDDYSQLGATRLVDYLSSHIQRALVE